MSLTKLMKGLREEKPTAVFGLIGVGLGMVGYAVLKKTQFRQIRGDSHSEAL